MIYELLGRAVVDALKIACSPSFRACASVCARARARTFHLCSPGASAGGKSESTNVRDNEATSVSPAGSPAPGTEINCNQHRCINQIVRRDSLERNVE